MSLATTTVAKLRDALALLDGRRPVFIRIEAKLCAVEVIVCADGIVELLPIEPCFPPAGGERSFRRAA